MDCIFCRIANGEIQSYKVYEDDCFIAILDISQATKGHTLLIPKQHFANVYEIDEEIIARIFKKIPEIAKAIKKAFNPIGLNILINTDKPLQSVFHFHVHLIPRYENDGVRMEFENNYGKLPAEEFLKIADEIKKNL
ncbi:MAG TPA: HIT family protein [Candidatus Izemoplasmatales bacterium]|nr:HIT family protein [Candidatus Izemoplasmatales bacterium]